MINVLMLAQHDNHFLHATYASTLTAALQLGGPITILVAGYACQTVVDAVLKQAKIQHIIVADAVNYQYFLAESLADLIVHLCETKGYTHVLASATRLGKDILPRVAGLLDVAMISDVVEIIDVDNFIRSLSAADILANIYSVDRVKLLAIHTTAAAFAVIHTCQNNAENNIEISIEYFTPVVINSRSWCISQMVYPSARPALTTAKIVVAGGRALQRIEDFTLIERIADRLHAAVGASRPAIDAGFISQDCQIGQTGKTIAPDLYIAIGISGAMHHVAGIRSSKVIVAINNDENAPIFEVADYGLVANLFEVLPLLEEELAKL